MTKSLGFGVEDTIVEDVTFLRKGAPKEESNLRSDSPGPHLPHTDPEKLVS
jgi:hypothetical protein